VSQTQTLGAAHRTALGLLDDGYWPVLIKAGAKAPIGKAWGAERWTPQRMAAAMWNAPDAGVGVCLGPGRGPGGSWLIDIEGDGAEAEAGLRVLFGGEPPPTCGWSSARGAHRLFKADPERLTPLVRRLDGALEADASGIKAVLKRTDKLPNFPADVEVRTGGFKRDGGAVKQVQSVCPPSVGTNGRPRVWTGKPPDLAELPDAFYAHLGRIADEFERARRGPRANPTRKAARLGTVARGDRAAIRPDTIRRAALYLSRVDPAISGSGGHNTAFRAACAVGPGFDLTPDEALALLAREYNPRCVPPWSDAELRHKIEDAYEGEPRRGWLLESDRPTRPVAARTPGDDEAIDTRFPIEVTTDEHIVNDEGVLALSIGEPNLFQRGGRLVRVLRVATHVSPDDDEAIDNAPKIVPVTPATLRGLLSRHAFYYVEKQGKEKPDNKPSAPAGDEPPPTIEVPVHVPRWTIDSIIDMKTWPGIKTLTGIAEHPIIRPDGSILSAQGYDRATGLVLRSTVDVPQVPTAPTRGDAEAAAGRLLDLVGDFPFDAPHGPAVWLAHLLTILSRQAIQGCTPMFLYDANTPGSGKSKLNDLVGLILTGRPMPRTAWPDRDDDEMRKVLTTAVLAGRSALMFDNVSGRVRSRQLEAFITSETWDGRILGQSVSTEDMAVTAVASLTGNNL
jgi:hypothetical protein